MDDFVPKTTVPLGDDFETVIAEAAEQKENASIEATNNFFIFFWGFKSLNICLLGFLVRAPKKTTSAKLSQLNINQYTQNA